MLGDDSRSITAGIIHFLWKRWIQEEDGRFESIRWNDPINHHFGIGWVRWGEWREWGGGGGEDNTPINSPRWMFLLIHWFYSSFISISFGRKRRRGREKVGVGEKTQRFVTLPRDSMQMKSVWFDLIRPTDSIWIVTRSTRRIFVVIAPILV